MLRRYSKYLRNIYQSVMLHRAQSVSVTFIIEPQRQTYCILIGLVHAALWTGLLPLLLPQLLDVPRHGILPRRQAAESRRIEALFA